MASSLDLIFFFLVGIIILAEANDYRNLNNFDVTDVERIRKDSLLEEQLELFGGDSETYASPYEYTLYDVDEFINERSQLQFSQKTVEKIELMTPACIPAGTLPAANVEVCFGADDVFSNCNDAQCMDDVDAYCRSHNYKSGVDMLSAGDLSVLAGFYFGM